jgi:hypothetical protein
MWVRSPPPLPKSKRTGVEAEAWISSAWSSDSLPSATSRRDGRPGYHPCVINATFGEKIYIRRCCIVQLNSQTHGGGRGGFELGGGFPLPVSVSRQAASLKRFSFCSGTSACKRLSVTWVASSGCEKQLRNGRSVFVELARLERREIDM